MLNAISDQGYLVVYLTARPIGQSNTTKKYLAWVSEGTEQLKLPNGPLLLSPADMLSALHLEVIAKAPEEFKIPLLKDVSESFNLEGTAIHAGFGNRETDTVSYRAVGVEYKNIYQVDKKGNVTNFNSEQPISYQMICENINDYFEDISGTHSLKTEEFVLA